MRALSRPDYLGRRLQLHHALDVLRPERLLKGLEGQTRELALDEVGPVLHDGLQLDVLGRRLPAGHEVQHVLAVCRLPLILALLAGEFHAEAREHGLLRQRVLHLEEPGVEVDLARQGRYGKQAGPSYQHEGRHGLVEEPGVAVGCLLQDDAVPPGPLGRGNLMNIQINKRSQMIQSLPPSHKQTNKKRQTETIPSYFQRRAGGHCFGWIQEKQADPSLLLPLPHSPNNPSKKSDCKWVS